MKKIIFYFDHRVKKVFVEKTDEATGEKKMVLSSPYNFVYTSEIVCRVINVEDDSQIASNIDPGYQYYNAIDFITIRAGEGIYFDQTISAYKASANGFIAFDGKSIILIPPVAISKDKLRAYYTVHPTKFGRIPSEKDIDEWLRHYNILASVGEKFIKEQLEAIDVSAMKVHRILIAQGKAPVNGHEEYFTPLISIEKKAGEIKSDGRIDFKETGSIIQITKGQEILLRHGEVKQVDGYDINGDKIAADIIAPNGFKRGENIVQSGHDENIFISALDGCLDVNRKVVSVLPIAIISGDVAYDSGNIDFNGSVHIKGSVLSGFTVKAKGDVIIEKNVDDGLIEATGDITVKMGVTGKGSSKLIAGGSVIAKYLLNAKVEATKDIIVEDSIINSDVFSNDKIVVVAKHGKIIGSRASALYDIIVNVSGAINETETTLSVGRNLFIERELAEVQKDVSKYRDLVTETMRQLKVNFGEGVFENPKEFLTILPPIKKKNCLLLLKELSDSNKELKRLNEVSKDIQDKLKLDREPSIIIMDKAFPGTILNIKKSVRKIDKEVTNAKYYEDPDEKVIRFTAAV